MLAEAANIVQEITLFVGRLAAGIFGAVVGAILTALFVWLICRMTVNKQPPRPIRKMLRILGAIAGAIAAILFLPIGYGGFGLGSGGLGLGPGGGGFEPQAVAPKSLSGIDPKDAATAKPEQRATVIMLGGPLVRGEAFYRFEDERAPQTLAEVQAKLRGRMQADPPLTALDIVIYFEDSLAQQSAPVLRLVEWSKQAGLSVNTVMKTGHVPP
jgi:hypothetical protein